MAARFPQRAPGWIGRRVLVRWDRLYVRLLHPQTGEPLREHLRQKRGWYPREGKFTLRKFQVMTENCRKFSRYARKDFHLMTESSA